jgi:uncharacterized protein (TIGR03083 family)
MTDAVLPSREEALRIVRDARARLTKLLDGFDDPQLEKPAALGGGSWSIKDLIGHLASWEERALSWFEKGGESEKPYPPTDEFNAAEVARKAEWPLNRIQEEAIETHNRLLDSIEKTNDEAWAANVPVPGRGDHPLGFIVGMTLAGDEHGLFAHDLAHLSDVEAYVSSLS